MVAKALTVASCLAAALFPGELARASQCIESYDASVTYYPFDVHLNVEPRADLTPDAGVASFAALFDITYGSCFKVVHEHLSQEQYVLIQCGAPNVSDAEVDAVASLPAGYTRKRFEIPLQYVATDSTVPLGFLEALGLTDRVKYSSKYGVAACWQKAEACNGGYEGQWGDATLLGQQNSEVDVIIADCYTTPCPANSDPQVIHFSSSQDPGALHSAEHIKFMAAFFNKEQEATTIFDAIVADYTAMVSAPAANAPKVAWIERQTASAWSSDDGFKVSLAGYKTRAVEDAGGRNVLEADLQSAFGADLTVTENIAGEPLFGNTLYLDSAGFDSVENASAAFFAALSDVDIVIDETYIYDPTTYTFQDFLTMFSIPSDSDLPFITNNKVFRLDGTLSVANDLAWFESRLVHAEWFLADMKRAIHDEGDSFTYIRNLAEGEGRTTVEESTCSMLLPACGEVAEPVEIPLLYEPGAAEATTTAADEEDADASHAPLTSMCSGFALFFVALLSLFRP